MSGLGLQGQQTSERMDGMKEAPGIFCCRDLVQLNSMSGCLPLTGTCGMDRSITHANVVESTDMEAWVNEGEVVISSGYPFRNNEDALIGKIIALKEKNIAALCLKPFRVNKISEAAIETAKDLDFALIELPMQAIFSNIIYEVTDAILQRKTNAFRMTQNCTEELLDVLLKENSMDQWLGEMERIIGNPILIFTSGREFLMSRDSSALIDAAAQETILRYFYVNDPSADKSVRIGEKQVAFDTIRVEHSVRDSMHVILLHFYGEVSDTSILALQRISRILSLEMKNATAIEKIRHKYEDTFVKDWLFDNFDNEFDLTIAAHSHGWSLNADKEYRVAIVNINTKTGSAFAEQDINVIHHIINHLDANIVFTIHAGKLILIFESGSDTADLLHFIERIKYIMGKEDMSFCVSRPTHIGGIPGAYLQAKKISEVSERCGITSPFITYDQLGVLSLLCLLPEDDAVYEYKDKFLKPLKTYDAAHHSSLLRTLQIYLSLNGNIKLTAQTLFTHYNTVTYRLEKIRNLLQMDINDSEVQLQIQIAFKLDLLGL